MGAVSASTKHPHSVITCQVVEVCREEMRESRHVAPIADTGVGWGAWEASVPTMGMENGEGRLGRLWARNESWTRGNLQPRRQVRCLPHRDWRASRTGSE